MKSSAQFALYSVLTLIMFGCEQSINLKESSFTGINPLAYTDVVFATEKDTVFVSTFSGRIAKMTSGKNSEELVIDLHDEIYSLVYSAKRNLIYASTMHSGVVMIDAGQKVIVDSLSINGAWISKLFVSPNGNFLAGYTSHRQNLFWDLTNNNAPISLPKSISEFKIVGFDASGNLLLKGKGKCIFWNPKTNEIEKEVIVSGVLADIDHSGNMLQLDGNYFQYYRADLDSISYRKQHPDWPYFLKEQDTTIRIPLQLSLTEGVLTDKYIFTAGIDRSIRKWNKLNGDLLQDLLKHKATISSMSISPDQSQLVSVDLKGSVVFTKISK